MTGGLLDEPKRVLSLVPGQRPAVRLAVPREELAQFPERDLELEAVRRCEAEHLRSRGISRQDTRLDLALQKSH